MSGARIMRLLLALALILGHVSGFAGVTRAPRSITSGGVHKADQRLANAVPRGTDSLDEFGEFFVLVVMASRGFLCGWS